MNSLLEKFQTLQDETTQEEVSFRPTEKVYLCEAKAILMKVLIKDINDKLELLKSMGFLIYDENDMDYAVSEVEYSRYYDEIVLRLKEKERLVKRA